MNSKLIPVFSGSLNNEATLLCNARKLHSNLKVGRRFATWIAERIKEYGFAENQDFIAISQKREIGFGRGRTEYHITIDMAKELAMVEKTEVGRQIRKYFIECERKLNSAQKLEAQTTVDQRTGLRDAVNALVGKRGLNYEDAYKIVHQRFGVKHIDELTLVQVQQATEYVHQLVLATNGLTADEVYELGVMLHYFELTARKMKEIEPALRILESRYAGFAHDTRSEIYERAKRKIYPVIERYKHLLTLQQQQKLLPTAAA